jgi:hypothetical protein
MLSFLNSARHFSTRTSLHQVADRVPRMFGAVPEVQSPVNL